MLRRCMDILWMSRFPTRRIASTSAGRTPGTLVDTSRRAEIDRLLHEASLQPSRESFVKAVQAFLKRDKRRRGHMEFITASLKWMEIAGLNKDLPTYNRLLDVFPRDRFRNRTLMDAIWPRPYPQIDAALRVLQKMEDNGIRPDYTTYSLLLEVFGVASLPVQKCRRIAYWFDRFENIDPYKLPQPIPNDPCELARLTLQRISSPGSQTKLFHLVRAEDETSFKFVIGSQAQWQREQLVGFASTTWEGSPLQVTGPHRTWLQHIEQNYFMLEAPPSPPQTNEGKSICSVIVPSMQGFPGLDFNRAHD